MRIGPKFLFESPLFWIIGIDIHPEKASLVWLQLMSLRGSLLQRQYTETQRMIHISYTVTMNH